MESVQLYVLLIDTKLGGPFEEHTPRYLSGMDTVRALWPLNVLFLPRLLEIRGLPYDKAFEREADAAIEAGGFIQGRTWVSVRFTEICHPDMAAPEP